MALDRVRNDAYAAALARVVTPDSVVLDLGAGTGVMGLMAARLGARHVYLVEPSDVLCVAEEIVAVNGLQDRVTCLRGRLEDVVVPEKVDVIVSVMTGNFLLTEDLLPVLFHARDTLLKPGGHLVPDAAVMRAVPVSAASTHDLHIAGWSVAQHGVDLGSGRAYAANTVHYGQTLQRDAAYLAEPRTLLSLDFLTATYDPLHCRVDFEAVTRAECHGLAGWFDMRLGDTWLSTSLASPQTHWSVAYLPVDPPMLFEQGDHVSLELDRLPEGDWNWRVKAPRESRRQSTMLGAPISPEKLLKARQTYVPPVTEPLAVAAFVLADVDGVRDVTTIAHRLQQAFPSRFATVQDALAFVQRVLVSF